MAETGSTAEHGSPGAPSVALVTSRLAEVWERIEAAGGSRDSVDVVGVTKTFPIEFIETALAVGIEDVGENYAQELVAKDDLATAAGLAPRWHFIGGLQRNKVKLLAGRVTMWHTMDRESLLSEVAKRCGAATVLIQVNTTDEPQKSGCDPTETMALVEHGRSLGLDVAGLMTVGPTGGGDPRPSFDQLRALAERCEVQQLSMGMSADYETAVAHGATIIRIGSVLFGPRSVSK